MSFVCLSHFAMVYFEKTAAKDLAYISYLVSQIASPTFMFVSGMMLGLLYQKHRSDFAPMRLRLMGRGVYLLTIVHFFILVPHIIYEGNVANGLRWMFITDTIGISMIVGPALIDRMSSGGRLLLSFLLYAWSTGMAFFWVPGNDFQLIAKDVFFGEEYSHGFFREFFALVPWFSVYFASSVLGERLVSYEGPDGAAAYRRSLWLVSATMLAIGVAVFAFRSPIREFGFRHLYLNLGMLVSPAIKRPPSPMYFIVHCGLGLAIFAAFMTWRRTNVFVKGLAKIPSLLGRTSLFTYVLHYYVYLGGFTLLDLPYSPFWPLLFVASLLIIAAGSFYWDRGDLNRRFIIPSLSLPAVRENPA